MNSCNTQSVRIWEWDWLLGRIVKMISLLYAAWWQCAVFLHYKGQEGEREREASVKVGFVSERAMSDREKERESKHWQTTEERHLVIWGVSRIKGTSDGLYAEWVYLILNVQSWWRRSDAGWGMGQGVQLVSQANCHRPIRLNYIPDLPSTRDNLGGSGNTHVWKYELL